MGFWKALTGKTWKETISGGGSSSSSSSSSNKNKDKDDKPTTLGQVSQTGQYAGDGFEWVQNDNTNALTRVYTGAGKDNNLGTNVITGGTSDKNTKTAIANISLNEGSAFAGTAASATDHNLGSLLTTGDSGASDSYAAQVGAVNYTPNITYDSTKTGAANEALREAKEAAAKAQAEKEAAAAALKEQQARLSSLPTGGPGTFAPGALPAAMGDDYTPTSAELAAQLEEAGLDDLRTDFSDIDYTTTATGRDFDLASELDSYDTLGGTTSFIDNEYRTPAAEQFGYEDTLLAPGTGGLSTNAYVPNIPTGGPGTFAPSGIAATGTASSALDNNPNADAAGITGLGSGTTELSSPDFAIPGTDQAAYATSASPGGKDPYDPRTILPTSEQMAELEGTAQEAVDLTPSVAQGILGGSEQYGFGDAASDLGNVIKSGGLQSLSGKLSGIGTGIDMLMNAYDPNLIAPGLAIPGVGTPTVEKSTIPFSGGSNLVRDTVAALNEKAENISDRISPEMTTRIENAMPDPRPGNEGLDMLGRPYGTDKVATGFIGAEEFIDTMADIGVVAGGAALAPFTGGASLPAALGFTALTSGAEAGGAAADEVTDLIADAVAKGEIQGTPDQIAALTNTARNQAYTQAGTIGGLSDTAVAATLGTTGVAKAILKSPFIAQQAAKLGISLGSEFGAGYGEQVVTNLAAQRAGADVGTTDAAFANAALEATGGGPGAATAIGIETAAKGVGTFMPTGGPGTVPTSGLPAANVLDPSKSPTAGQLATSTVPTAYNPGESEATSMDVMAAQEIINEQIRTTGTVDPKILSNLQDSTGLSMEELSNMVSGSPVAAGTPVDQNLTDEITGITGGSNISVTPNADGTTTLVNNETGRMAVVNEGDNLGEAISTFDEVTTSVPGSENVTETAVQTELDLSGDSTTEAAAAAEAEAAAAAAAAAEATTESESTTEGKATTESESTTEGKPTTEGTSTVTIATDVEDEPVEIEVEDEVNPPKDEGVEVEVETPMVVPPVTRTNDKGEEIVECPEGYTMVQTAEGPICQKTRTAVRQRAGAGTRAYTGLATRGQRGPGQRRITITDTERVDPITRSA